MATMDLAAKFHQETGMYADKHSTEYIKWLEGIPSDKCKKEDETKTLTDE